MKNKKMGESKLHSGSFLAYLFISLFAVAGELLTEQSCVSIIQ